MKKSSENTSSIIEIVQKAKKYNVNLGSYVEHFLNENFNFSVKLNNGYAVIISRNLAHDFGVMPSILTEQDLIDIANSAWKIG